MDPYDRLPRIFSAISILPAALDQYNTELIENTNTTEYFLHSLMKYCIITVRVLQKARQGNDTCFSIAIIKLLMF